MITTIPPTKLATLRSQRHLAELRRLHSFAEARAEDDERHGRIAAELAALISRYHSRTVA